MIFSQFGSKFFEKVSYVVDIFGHKFGPVACIIAFVVSKDIFWIHCTYSCQRFDVPSTSGQNKYGCLKNFFRKFRFSTKNGRFADMAG